MKFWPSDSFEIVTSIPQEEIVAFFKSEVSPREWYIFNISKDGFMIARKINYQNSSLPIIHGIFRTSQSGVTISIRMQLYTRMIVFLSFVFCFSGLVILFLIIGLIMGKVRISLGLLAPVLIPLFAWGLFSGGFWFEVEKQKPIIRGIFLKKVES